MGLIKKLDPVLIDRIAAGEIIERPASVVKELIENSIDAKATEIEVHTYEGGKKKIVVRDNGEGILREDVPLAIEKHATSKISTLKDMENITSFGFRGEALASIASVSYIEIQTKHISEELGTLLQARGGTILSLKPYPALQGTKVVVEDLFYSTPARRKFLKGTHTENRYIIREITKFALAYPEVSFHYTKDGDEELSLSSVTFPDLPERMRILFHPELVANLIPVEWEEKHFSVRGWIGKPLMKNSVTGKQFSFVNRRPVEIKNLAFLIKKAYGNLLDTETKPVFFLFFEIPVSYIDVNIHPAKKEIRIFQEEEFFTFIVNAVKNSLNPKTYLDFTVKENLSPDFVRETSPSGLFQETGILYTEKETPLYVAESSKFPVKIHGTVFNTYILASGEEELYIIDQHTANERINYEKKRKQLLQYGIRKQNLLYPVTVKLSREEIEIWREFAEKLRSLCFEWDEFPDNTVVLRSMPDILEPEQEKEELLQILRNLRKGYNFLEIYDDYIASKACKASIRKNDIMPPEVLSRMVSELFSCENPSRCPHGRPTIIKLSRKEIDKLFYRYSS